MLLLGTASCQPQVAVSIFCHLADLLPYSSHVSGSDRDMWIRFCQVASQELVQVLASEVQSLGSGVLDGTVQNRDDFCSNQRGPGLTISSAPTPSQVEQS